MWVSCSRVVQFVGTNALESLLQVTQTHEIVRSHCDIALVMAGGSPRVGLSGAGVEIYELIACSEIRHGLVAQLQARNGP